MIASKVYTSPGLGSNPGASPDVPSAVAAVPSSHTPASFVSRFEMFVGRVLFTGLAALHVVYAFVFRLDSDEPQHLHVVWGWTQGKLPYRDFFDNHSPLFSWLCSPVLRMLGERADIIPWMRLAMLPLWAVCLACVYRLGAHLFSRRAGWWAAAGAGFFPLYFYTSTEFRADNLWTALWLLTLAVLLTGRVTTARMFFFGLTLGTTFATSMKTTLLAGALLLAGGLILAVRWKELKPMVPAAWLGRAAAMLGGLILVPGAFMAFFALHDAWQPFVYCIITHNTLPGMADGHGWRQWRPLLFPLVLPGLLQGTRFLLRRGDEVDPWRVQRIFFLLVALGYPLLLVSFWPLLTAQDYLPAILPLALLVAASIFPLAHPAPREAVAIPHRRGGAALLPSIVTLACVCAEITALFFIHGPWRDRTGPEQKLLAATLSLTASTDSVMDDKGETVYRQRPFYYALETITRERLNRGLIPDDIAERLIAARTAVVHLTFLPLPKRARAFVRANYVSVGPVAVLGKVINAADDPVLGSTSHRYFFQIAVPARYVVLDEAGVPVAGHLDGQTLDGRGQWIAPGPHEFDTGEAGRLTVFWADASDRGFCPSETPAVDKLHE